MNDVRTKAEAEKQQKRWTDNISTRDLRLTGWTVNTAGGGVEVTYLKLTFQVFRAWGQT